MDFAILLRAGTGRRSNWIVMLVVVTALQTGCAQLNERVSKGWTGFGSKEASKLREERTPGLASTGDLYAKSVGKDDATSPSELASQNKLNRSQQYADSELEPKRDRDSSGQTDQQSPRRRDSDSQMVVLQIPESLPNLDDDAGEVVAEHPETLADLHDASTTLNSQLVKTDNSYRNPISTASSSEPRASQKLTLGEILTMSRETIDRISTYQVKMNHQERVNGKLDAPENAILSIRREPKAVRIEWPEGPNQGREVLYLSDEKGGMMHVHMPNALLPTLTMSPTSPLATRNSRHPISEAGLDTILSKMEEAYQSQNKPDNAYGVISYLGLEKQPDGLEHDSYKIMRMTPNGEQWVVYVDSVTKLPCEVEAKNDKGELLERYFFTNPKIETPELSLANAFDPETRWGASKGLFSRLARSAKEKGSETR